MAEVNHGVVLNEEYSPQDLTRALLAHYRSHSSRLSLANNCTTRRNENEEMDGEDIESEKCKDAALNSRQEEQNTLKQDVNDLKHKMTYISHQVTLLLNALHVPSCQCAICKPLYESQVNLFTKFSESAKSIVSPSQQENTAAASANNGGAEQNQSKMESSEVPVSATIAQSSSTAPSMNECEALLSQIFTHTGLNALSGNNLAAGFSNFSVTTGSQHTKPFVANTAINNQAHQCSNPSGRKSKYCSAEEKKAVAEYAQLHGPSAAARKFGIPPPVAAYYHRKEYKQNKPQIGTTGNHSLLAVSAASPGTTSGDDFECGNEEWQGPGSNIAANEALKSQDQSSMTNPAHSTGSPGFLRGRGRGRPKLIGDELDAELVDYMVQVKQSDPRGHLTASQALTIARDYIMEKAPGLLEEHGGQIKLKLTWAMKLVSRIAERQKEVELGLPPGTISNMSRTMTVPTVNVPGGNFMTDMVAQNLLSQQVSQMMNQAVTGGAASATPQILNVRKLELPKYSEKGDVKKEIVDIENSNDSDMGNVEQQYSNGIENHESDQQDMSNNTSDVSSQPYISTNAF